MPMVDTHDMDKESRTSCYDLQVVLLNLENSNLRPKHAFDLVRFSDGQVRAAMSDRGIAPFTSLDLENIRIFESWAPIAREAFAHEMSRFQEIP
jgi:hypothetical protein